jgi:hypothetical protein
MDDEEEMSSIHGNQAQTVSISGSPATDKIVKNRLSPNAVI